VDDGCPEGSGRLAEKLGRKNLTVIYDQRNLGVGGAMITGYRKSFELGYEIVVKIGWGRAGGPPDTSINLLCPFLRTKPITQKKHLEELAREGQLMAYKHCGFWQPMDTLRDKVHLESM
jgi:glycosyltransferase involved in cell wall biosynthesis